MVKVAIAGGPGTGKSTVRGFFEALGAHAIDLDGLARKVVEPHRKAFRDIVAYFGGDVVSPDGTLNRRRIRNLVVRDPEKRRVLEEITHPEIFRLLNDALSVLKAMDPGAVVVVEVPLLFRSGSAPLFDFIVWVEAKPEIQIQRIVKRDRCSVEEAEAMLRLHPSREEKKMVCPQFVIDNSGPVEQTRLSVAEILGRIEKHV